MDNEVMSREELAKSNATYGRLLESVHYTGYSMERACMELEDLLEDDKWKSVGNGFEKIDDFLKTINLSEFKIAVDRRRKLAKKLDELEATQRATAKALGVGKGTIARDVEAGPNGPEEKNNSLYDEELEIDNGPSGPKTKPYEKPAKEISKGLEKEAKREEKKEERETKIEEIKKSIKEENVKLPKGLFDVIAIDPPWNYGRAYDPESSRVANPYPEMTQNELLQLEIPGKENSILFLWTTHAFIWDAKELMNKWGYTYKATIVWNKQKIGMGAWYRMQCEFCLFGIKGKPFFNNTTYRDIIEEPRREHSRKPEGFYDMVESVTTGRRLDYFAREKREGWEVYGSGELMA